MDFAWLHKKSTQENPSETLDQRVAALEAGMRQLLLEWEDSYERLHRLMARVNKRYRDQAEQEKKTHEDAPGPPNAAAPGLDPISAAIHARRARGLPPGGNGR